MDLLTDNESPLALHLNLPPLVRVNSGVGRGNITMHGDVSHKEVASMGTHQHAWSLSPKLSVKVNIPLLGVTDPSPLSRGRRL